MFNIKEAEWRNGEVLMKRMTLIVTGLKKKGSENIHGLLLGSLAHLPQDAI